MSQASPRVVYNRLRSNGLTHNQACGVLGNIQQESNFETAVLGFDKTGSYGLCQWLGSRKAHLIRYAAQHDSNPANQLLQTDFIAEEFRTTETRARDKLKATTTVREAALAFSKYYERPSKRYAHNEKRVAYAERFAREFAPGA